MASLSSDGLSPQHPLRWALVTPASGWGGGCRGRLGCKPKVTQLVEGFQPSPSGFRTSVYQQSVSQDWPVSQLRWPPGGTPRTQSLRQDTSHLPPSFHSHQPPSPSRARPWVPALLIRPFHKPPVLSTRRPTKLIRVRLTQELVNRPGLSLAGCKGGRRAPQLTPCLTWTRQKPSPPPGCRPQEA